MDERISPKMNFIRMVEAFWSKKLTPATTKAWLADLDKIKDEALPWLYAQATGWQKWPDNFCLSVKRIYQSWPGHIDKPTCPCRLGLWEVARYNPATFQWDIWQFACRTCTGEGYTWEYLLKPGIYQNRKPNRSMAEPPPWAWVFPDQASIACMVFNFPRLSDLFDPETGESRVPF